MATNHLNAIEDLKMLEYVLEDFLEVKACLDPSQTKPLKQFLFSQGLDGLHLSAIEGFRLANHLVVIEGADPRSIEHLIFLNPEDGGIRVRSL